MGSRKLVGLGNSPFAAGCGLRLPLSAPRAELTGCFSSFGAIRRLSCNIVARANLAGLDGKLKRTKVNITKIAPTCKARDITLARALGPSSLLPTDRNIVVDGTARGFAALHLMRYRIRFIGSLSGHRCLTRGENGKFHHFPIFRGEKEKRIVRNMLRTKPPWLSANL